MKAILCLSLLLITVLLIFSCDNSEGNVQLDMLRAIADTLPQIYADISPTSTMGGALFQSLNLGDDIGDPFNEDNCYWSNFKPFLILGNSLMAKFRDYAEGAVSSHEGTVIAFVRSATMDWGGASVVYNTQTMKYQYSSTSLDIWIHLTLVYTDTPSVIHEGYVKVEHKEQTGSPGEYTTTIKTTGYEQGDPSDIQYDYYEYDGKTGDIIHFMMSSDESSEVAIYDVIDTSSVNAMGGVDSGSGPHFRAMKNSSGLFLQDLEVSSGSQYAYYDSDGNRGTFTEPPSPPSEWPGTWNTVMSDIEDEITAWKGTYPDLSSSTDIFVFPDDDEWTGM
jgi:hypothetical protein